MELFKFTPGTDVTLLEQGTTINNWSSVMWVERYLEAGEFEIKAPLSTGLQSFLPLGTLISHIDTLEVMIVENHQIIDDASDPSLSITGRSLDSFLENRIVGQELVRVGSAVTDYVLPAAYTSVQAVKLINDHIRTASGVADPNDALTNVEGHTFLTTIAGGEVDERTLDRKTVYEALIDILHIDDLGIQSMRRNSFTSDTPLSLATLLRVYTGVDKTKTIHFTWYSGDFNKIEYLFTNKQLKTSAMVTGRWVWAIYDRSPTKYARKMMLVDASDLDDKLTAMPTGGTLTTLVSKMQIRGRTALRRQHQITISSAEVSNIQNYIYRRDYNLGDLVVLDGNYGDILTMRVVEHAEIEDENGRSSHPTLAVPGV